MKIINYENYKIDCINGCDFTAFGKDYNIRFLAEYKKGCYSKVISIYDNDKKRCYKSQRYFYKFLPLISDITFELLKNGMLWNYEDNEPALKTYKKDIEPYYKECKEKGLSLYNDEEFLNNLFNN